MANESTGLTIKEHDFQEAKNSLKKYTEKAQQDVTLSRVPNDGGLFHLGSHKVEGYELNNITKQIQDYLIKINDLNAGLVSEFGQVYSAFESLDKDYIAGIVTSIKAAEKVSAEEQKDRADIKRMIASHEKSVEVLQKFKADIDKLKHITDVDKAWELIDQQAQTVQVLRNYKEELTALKHLKDVDKLWEDESSLAKQVNAIDAKADSIDRKAGGIDASVEDIQILVSDIEAKIDEFLKTVEGHSTALAELAQAIEECRGDQQEFIESSKQDFNDYRAVIDQRLDKNEQTMQANFDSLNEEFGRVQSGLNEQVESLSKAQDEKIAELESSQTNALERISQEQAQALEAIKEAQSEKLERISRNQIDQLANINQSLEDEKKSLRSTVDEYGVSLAEFAQAIEGFHGDQQAFIESSKQDFNEYRTVIDQRLDKNDQAMRANVDSLNKEFERMQSDLNKQVESLSKAQDEKIAELESSQASEFERISQDQVQTLEAIKETQAEKLEQVSRDQIAQLANINQSLEEEKESLHNTVDELTQKIKTAYIVAGTAVTLTVVHFILSIIGII